MAYRRNYGKRNYKRGKKYTNAEKIAFRLGQEQKVRESIRSGAKNTRVYDAFVKGLAGAPVNSAKKPLF